MTLGAVTVLAAAPAWAQDGETEAEGSTEPGVVVETAVMVMGPDGVAVPLEALPPEQQAEIRGAILAAQAGGGGAVMRMEVNGGDLSDLAELPDSVLDQLPEMVREQVLAERAAVVAEREAVGLDESAYDAMRGRIAAIQRWQRELDGAPGGPGGIGGLDALPAGLAAEFGGGSTAGLTDEGRALHEAVAALREAVDADRDPATLIERTDAVAGARAAIHAAIAGARAELREGLTPRQEAYFVLRGVLD